MYVNIMLNQVLIASKRQAAWTWAMVGATVVNPVLNLLLIPLTAARYDNGAIGAAIALLVTEVLVVVFGFATVGSCRARSSCARSLRAHSGRLGRALGDGVRDPAVRTGRVARRCRPGVRRTRGRFASPDS